MLAIMSAICFDDRNSIRIYERFVVFIIIVLSNNPVNSLSSHFPEHLCTTYFNQDLSLYQSSFPCIWKTHGNFTYFDARNICSVCSNEYQKNGLTCPELPENSASLQDMDGVLPEGYSAYLISHENNANCETCKVIKRALNSSKIETVVHDCSLPVNTVLCVSYMFDLADASRQLIEFKESKDRETAITEQVHIVKTVNAVPQGTWKAKLNIAGLPHFERDENMQNASKRKFKRMQENFLRDLSTGDHIPEEAKRFIKDVMESNMTMADKTPMLLLWNIHNAKKSDTEKYPESFDTRLKWKQCSHMTRPTLNQGSCGSCYAVASVAAISDRICVSSNGTIDVHLSVAEYLSCNNDKKENSCGGGWDINVFQYWIDHGLTTGGPYGSNEGCWSYEFNNDCGRPCSLKHYTSQVVPECRKTCNSAMHDKTFDEDKYYGKELYWVVDSNIKDFSQTAEQDMKRELMHRGPIVASMQVPEDFIHYQSGVYQYVTGEIVYGHVVRMLGWGVENGTPYWLASNSWGRDWGEKGFFKILRGSNEMLIESKVLAGTPLL